MRKLVLVALFLLHTSLGHCAIAHVQSLDASTASDDGATQTRSVTWTGGNLGIVWACGWISGGSPSITSVIGSSSGTWTEAVSSTLASNRICAIYYKENIANGADVVTVTWSAALSNGRIAAHEYSGVSLITPVGYTNSCTGCGDGLGPSGGVNLVDGHANTLYFAVIHVLGDAALSVSTSGATQRSEAEVFLTVSAQDKITTGSLDMTWTSIGANFYTALGATFILPRTPRRLTSSLTP